MKKNKVVASCNPESVVVDVNAMPNYQSQAMCRTLLGCINKYFENPVITLIKASFKTSFI